MPTKIEWAEETWNPVSGCTKVSEGCQHCYAERMAKRLAGRFGYPADEPFRVTFHEDRLNEPLRWRKPRRVFVCSMGDLFHEAVPLAWVELIYATMLKAPQHTYLILTKRPERMQTAIRVLAQNQHLIAQKYGAVLSVFGGYGARPPSHIWLGVTAETQKRADERIPILLQTSAAVRFVSVEPMLSEIRLRGKWLDPYPIRSYDTPRFDRHTGKTRFVDTPRPSLDWIIVGGETGPGARPMHPDWARSIRDQCQAVEKPFFFKGWGEWAPWITGFGRGMNGVLVRRDGTIGELGDGTSGTGMCRVGKPRSGRLLDGREWNEYPEVANDPA